MELKDVDHLCQLALQYLEAGHYVEAEKCWEDALVIAQSRFPNDHPDIVAIRLELVGVHVHFGRYDEA